MKPVLLVLSWFVGLALATAGRAEVSVVEYYHSGFGHYFITANPAEAALIDSRPPALALWSRTGLAFRAYAAPGAPDAPAGAVAICRFFNASFAPKSSHFYAPKGLGCETTIANYADWLLEDEAAFATLLPDAGGACPAGHIPVYRLYNSGQTGAPNHRFVTSLAERQAMLDRGFVAEGPGLGVGMCVPSPVAGRTTAEGFWRGQSNQGQDLLVAVLGDQQYFLLYTNTGATWPTGAVTGRGTYEDATFRSSSVRMVPFDGPSFVGGFAAITATFAPAQSMSLTNGTTTANLAYDAGYDSPVPLATLAGVYRGLLGRRTESSEDGRATVFADGQIILAGRQCGWIGMLTPRSGTAVFDLVLDNTAGACASATGFAFYDAPTKRLVVLAPFEHTFPDMLYSIGTRD